MTPDQEQASIDATMCAMEAVSRVMELPKEQRRDYLEMLGHVATKYMRSIGGDEYVRGWLEAAIAELQHPSAFVLRKPQ